MYALFRKLSCLVAILNVWQQCEDAAMRYILFFDAPRRPAEHCNACLNADRQPRMYCVCVCTVVGCDSPLCTFLCLSHYNEMSLIFFDARHAPLLPAENWSTGHNAGRQPRMYCLCVCTASDCAGPLSPLLDLS